MSEPSNSNQSPDSKLQVTKPAWSVLSAVIGMGSAWVWLQASRAWDWPVPRFPIAAAIVFALLALGSLVFAILASRRRETWYEHGVILLAVGKTYVIAGAGLFGGYLVLAIHNLRFEAPAVMESFISLCVAVVSAIILVVAGYLIQNACRVPPDDTPD